MKIIFPLFLLSGTYAAFYKGRTGINPKIYDLDHRPVAKRVEFPKPDGECTVSPWLLWMMLDRTNLQVASSQTVGNAGDANAPTLSQTYSLYGSSNTFVSGPGGGPGTVLQLISNCQNNQDFRAIMSIDYIMADNPSIASDAGISQYKGLPNDEVYKFLGIQFGESLSDWSDSKIFTNIYKWRMYNEIMRGTQLFDIKRFQQQVDLYKEVKDEAEIEHSGSGEGLLKLRDTMPFLDNIGSLSAIIKK